MHARSLFFVAGFLVACGGAAPLSGSLADACDLTYSHATIQNVGGVVELRFLQTRGTQEDTALKVSVTLDPSGLPKGSAELDLTEMMPGGAQRGVASRNVLNDPDTAFPLLLRGTMSLDSDLTTATDMTGAFSMTFVQGDVFASGLAVFGSFDAEVMK
jgi:hypothetical protein